MKLRKQKVRERREKNGDGWVSWEREYAVCKHEPENCIGQVQAICTHKMELSFARSPEQVFNLCNHKSWGEKRNREEIIYLGQWFSKCVLGASRDPKELFRVLLRSSLF